MRAGQGRRPVMPVLLAPVVLAVAVGVYIVFAASGNAASNGAESRDPCDGPDVFRAAFLVDLRKPLDAGHAALPGALLRRAALEMAPGTDLGVYALSPHAEAPRTLLGRLCKTVDLAGLATESSKHSAADDCDLPAQVPPAARASARDFCRQRDTLVRRVDALAVETLGQGAGPAYLVEALEATAREFEGTPGTLHVFSDLVQHARWFSHAETPLPEWDYGRMTAAWSGLLMEEPLRGFPPGTAVRIHYVPRVGTTDAEDGRTAHKRFWEGYFGGIAVAFDDQPAMAGYVPPSLAEASTAMEQAAYELERLRHSGALVERERAELARERAELARERQSLREARRRIEAEREELAAERRELAAARERLDTRGRGSVAPASATSEDGVRLVGGQAVADVAGGGR